MSEVYVIRNANGRYQILILTLTPRPKFAGSVEMLSSWKVLYIFTKFQFAEDV